MRNVEIFVIFLLVLLLFVGVTIPMWWDNISPHIFNIPKYIGDIIQDIQKIIDTIIKPVEYHTTG